MEVIRMIIDSIPEDIILKMDNIGLKFCKECKIILKKLQTVIGVISP